MKGKFSLLLKTLLCLWVFPFGFVVAQKTGIRGKIQDKTGKPVPFATIGVEKKSLGTMANEEGNYLLELPKGSHTVYFQCLGYQTVRKEFEISSGVQESDVSLSEQVLQTKEVTIASRNEDPAYAIMRKAIARARINKLLVDSYTAEAYIRGSGRILDLPFFLRSLAKDNGFDENTVFFKETLEQIQFRQPNIYKEKVVASRSTFGIADINQNYLKEDLYDPNFGNSVSPLSPSSFRYYRFQYLGAFSDRGHEVFKIKVIPKVRGQKIWEGEIYILDRIWCIHSAHLSQEYNGFDVTLSHTYGPMEGIWLPVQLKQEIKGKVLQILIEAKYSASIRKYKLVKNERLYADFQKLEQELDEKTNKAIEKDPVKVDFKSVEKQDKKLMRTLAKAYIKEKLGLRRKDKTKEKVPASVAANMTYEIDSNATKKDSVFWMENRAVPLTDMEVRSYHKLDSIRIVEEKKDSVDSKKKAPRVDLSFLGILLGKEYQYGKKDSLKRKPYSLQVFSPLGNLTYNAVEGYALEEKIWFRANLRQSRSRFRDDRTYIQFGPTVRYSFGRKKLIGSGVFQFGHPNWMFQVIAGTDVRQINNDEPISQMINTSYAFVDRRSLIRLYEADFARVQFLRKLSGRIEAEVSLEWENRIPLRNSTLKDYRGKSITFEENLATMHYAAKAVTQRSVVSKAILNLDWFPTLASDLYNEQQSFRSTSSPRFRFQIQHAVHSLFQSNVDFTQASFSYRHSIELTKGTQVEIFSRASSFLRSVRFGQMDALHMFGNQTFLLNEQSAEQFRNLPYYSYSSSKPTFETHLQVYRDELALGWFFPGRRNWREMILVNGMFNEGQPGFFEVGYGVDKLFRLIHMEIVNSRFQGGKGSGGFSSEGILVSRSGHVVTTGNSPKESVSDSKK